MYFTPTIPADLAPVNEPIECYSDWHKDAFGCRPVSGEPADPMDRALEIARLEAWQAEGERIEALANEVAKFRLSRNLEYIMRSTHFGCPSMKRAMEIHVALKNERSVRDAMSLANEDWDYICYQLELPYSEAAPLKAWYEGLDYGSAEIFSRWAA